MEGVLMKILFSPYATKSDIRELMGGGRWDNVSKVFDARKKLENDPLNIRPNKVPSQLVFKVLGLNYSFAVKQYKEQNSTLIKETGELSI
jgi:hypothetical protein